MAFFEALQNQTKAHNGDYANGNIVLVKDGFCWPALFFTPLWLIFSGMWLVLIIYIGLWLVFAGLANAGFISDDMAFWAEIGISLLFAYEANFLRKWTLQRGNYRPIGVSLGRNLLEAEVNFFGQFIAPNNAPNNAPTNDVPTGDVNPTAHTATSSADIIVNPISTAQTTQHQKSHWKIGGKRKSDSVVGMFSDD